MGIFGLSSWWRSGVRVEGTAVDPAGVPGGAPLASPAFTGTPTAPTPAPGANNAQLATAAYVAAADAATTNKNYLNGVLQEGTYTFTGTTDGNGLFVVDLTAATPAMATAYLMSAVVLGASGSGNHGPGIVILTAFTVEFKDLSGNPLTGTDVSITVGGTLA